MNSSRRSLLKGLLVLAAAPHLIKEMPRGREFISLYTTPKVILPSQADILALEVDRISKHIPVIWEKQSAFYEMLSKNCESFILTREMRIPLQFGRNN